MEEKRRASLAEENEKKKQYLKAYQFARRRERDILQEIDRIRERKMFPSIATGDGMPHGNKVSDLSEYAAILDSEIEKLKKERLKEAKLYRDIEARISDMTDSNEQRVLRLRYIQGLTWERVAVEMGYSWTQMHRIHSRALGNFKL